MPFLLFLLLASLDLDSVRNEPNLERRAELALDNANQAIDRAKQHAAEASFDKLHQAVAEVQESVELCQESLAATGKDPRKNTRQFKRIEMRIHQLTRRMRGFASEVSIEDKPAVERVANRLDEINDEIVTGIFTKKKKVQQP
jgi:DNA repair ATPase RecN